MTGRMVGFAVTQFAGRGSRGGNAAKLYGELIGGR